MMSTLTRSAGALRFPLKVLPVGSRSYSTTSRQAMAAAAASTESPVAKMHKLYNSQITKEFNASQLYLSASIWCDQKELTGMASFTRAESCEERDHALEMVDFALKRDIPVSLEALPAPNADWTNIEALWADLLEAEKSNSQALYMLADAAQACQDHAVTTFLMPFHSEQVDAVASMKTILAKVREESQTPGLIRQLDHQLGEEAGEKKEK